MSDIEKINVFDKLVPVVTGATAVIGFGAILLILKYEMLQTLIVWLIGILLFGGAAFAVGQMSLSLWERSIRIQKELILAGTVRQIDVHSAPIRPNDRPEMLSLPNTQNPEVEFPDLNAEPKEQYPDLMPLLAECDRVLVVAGQGAGKTTLLTHSLYQDMNQGGQCVVIDSHAEKGQWPERVRVVGIGRDYAAITRAIKAIAKELDKRYQTRAATSGAVFPRLNLYIDEFFVLNQNCDVQAEICSLLAECRKVNIRLFCCGHSENAADIGLKGHSGLRTGYDAIIHLHRDQSGERYAMVRMGEDKDKRHIPGVRYALPGPVTVSQKGVSGGVHEVHEVHGVPGGVPGVPSDFKVHRDGVPGGVPGVPEDDVHEVHDDDDCGYTEMSDEEKIRMLHSKGLSVSEICLLVWKKKGGKQYQKIRSVIAEMTELKA